MPSRKKYKTEEDYQRALKTKSEVTAYIRHQKELQAKRTVCEIAISGWGAVPEYDETASKWAQHTRVQNESEKVGERIRKKVISRWKKEKDGDAIVNVYHRWYPKKGVVSYRVTLTGKGAILQGEWLAGILKEEGMDIGSFYRRGYKLRDIVMEKDEIKYDPRKEV